MLTRNEIMTQLEPFGFAVGKPVIVHTSLKAVGEIEGGGQTLLDCLIEFFTRDNGIFCVPTHTWRWGYLDMRSNETCIGVMPNLAAAHPDGTRTPHPTHSMAVFGKREFVDEFVRNEENMPTPGHPDGCYGKIYKAGGHVMLLGVNQTKNTYLHCVEEIIGVPNRLSDAPSARKVIYKDGRETTVFTHGHDAHGIAEVSGNYWKYEPAFRLYGCIFDGTLGDAKVQMCSARKMKDVMEIINNRRGDFEIFADRNPLDEALYKI